MSEESTLKRVLDDALGINEYVLRGKKYRRTGIVVRCELTVRDREYYSSNV